MIELARTSDGLSFCLLEYPSELDKLKVGEFDYFRKYLGMTDYMANFRSWLKRPSVFLLLIISNGAIVGWSMNEKWSKPSLNGRPVFVLRAIEISPELSRQGHGRSLFVIVSSFLPGYIITKPVNTNARLFFGSLGFLVPDARSPVDLRDHPGYLVLPEDDRSSPGSDILERFAEQILAAKTKKFPKEVVSPARSKIPEEDDSNEDMEDVDPCSHKPEYSRSQIIDSTDGEFEGDQKMMTPCRCGGYLTGKFLRKGSGHGTAFVCLQCGAERYFLPLKK
ncbi:MAG: hypothetical protein JW705_08355 [Methanosarcinaceae archaeon]|nr:hypothetical protein [Methanosarcinaceae archaeon]